MVRDAQGVVRRRATRRSVLHSMGVGGALALAGCDGNGTATPADTSLSFMLATAQSGEYGTVGTHERYGFEMAVSHLNEGGGLVDEAFDDLSGDGVLGETVETITEDTENTASTARSQVDRVLAGEDVAMVTGGVGGDVVYAISEVAHDQATTYMAGTAPVPGLSGSRCAATTFRETAHADTVVEAMGPALANELGDSLTFYQLSSEATEGQVLQDAVTSYFNRSVTADWRPQGRDSARPGSGNFDAKLQEVAANRPDLLVLNLFGLDAINAVNAAQEHLDEDTPIVVPVIDDSLGLAVESAMSGVYGTIPWDAGVGGELSGTFDEEYILEYGPSAGGQAQTGSGTAHVTYTQTLLFAAAAERAGSVDPDAVRTELEGMQYDVGFGQQQMRACDHQSTRPVTVVRGIENTHANLNRLEVLASTNALAPCEEAPAADCSF